MMEAWGIKRFRAELLDSPPFSRVKFIPAEDIDEHSRVAGKGMTTIACGFTLAYAINNNSDKRVISYSFSQ
jgi:hypothetical protein